MLPQKFKTMFGLKDQKDLKMANNIWKMLDEMSSNDPDAYQKFIQKNLTEGLTDAKAQKQKKQKPYKIIPREYLLVELQADLTQQLLTKQIDAEFKQKLDMNINKEKWSDVKARFPSRIKIFVNICHSDRVKLPTLKSRGGAEAKDFNAGMLKDIESLYYSFQGPYIEDCKPIPIWYFCLIFNSIFVQAFDVVPNGNGRRIFLGICAAYFEQRLKNDRNPILAKVNTLALYGKNLYYKIDKPTVQVHQSKKFLYGKYEKACEFLLEREIDVKEREDDSKPLKEKEKKAETKTLNPQKKQQILIHPKKQVQKETSSELPPLIPTQAQPQKKVLIQVLDEHENQPQAQTTIPYQLKQSQQRYSIEFLVPGIDKIENLDLQVSSDTIKLKTLNKEPQCSVEIKLKRAINADQVKAKMKKKLNILAVSLSYL